MQDNTNYKWVIYARRSKERRDKEEKVNSIEDQLAVMRQIANDCGLKVVRHFAEDHSALKPGGRIEFTAMMEYIKAGKANAILCWDYDRLTRNPEEDGKIRQFLTDGQIREIKTPRKEHTSKDNQIVVSLEGAMSAEYIRKLIENIKRGMYGAAARGFRPSIAPIGYKNSRYREDGKQEEILVDEPNFKLLRRMFDLVLSKRYTPFEVLKIATEQWQFRSRRTKRYPNGRPLSRTSWYNILCNEFYTSWYEFPAGSGNRYKGNHKALITRAEYDEIQDILGRGGARNRSHHNAYVGLMRCGECGARITCENKTKHQKNGNIHHYTYYHCTGQVSEDCTQKSLRQDGLEEQVLQFLSSIKISPAFHEWAISELKKEYEREKTDKSAIIYLQERQLHEVRDRLERLFELRLAGDIESDRYKEEKKKLSEEEKRLQGYLDSVDQRVQNWIYDAERVLTFAERAVMEYQKGDADKKRSILSALGTEHVLKDRVLTIETEKPLLVVQEAVSHGEMGGNRLEPANFVGKHGRNGQKTKADKERWRWGESNSRPKKNPTHYIYNAYFIYGERELSSNG